MIKHRKPRHPRRLAAAASAVALMLGGGLALGTAGASAQNINAQQEVSQNWSGYVVQGSTGQSVTSVSGSWVQPSANSTTTGQAYAAFWVGLGGASQQSQSLEQVGTSTQVVNGQTTYSAWYELLPSAQVALPLTIHAGDHVAGKVTVNGTSVTISLSDQTTGQSVTKTLQMANPDTTSAEWIAEAPAAQFPNGGTQILPLANFGQVTFSNASATAGGQNRSISSPAWTVEKVDMSSAGTSSPFGSGGNIGPAGLQVSGAQQSSGSASAGGVSDNGTSFTVAYSSQPGSGGVSSSTSGSAGPGYPGQGYPGQGYPGWAYGYPGSYVQ